MSTHHLDWLPPCLDTNGSWDEILTRLWEVFDQQITSGLFLKGRPVWHDQRISEGKPEGFWHITHRDELVYDPKRRAKVKQRIFDPARSACLPWLRAILENHHRDEVLMWDYREEDGRLTTYLWLESLDYVIVLAHWNTNRGNTVYRIITAYVTDYPRKREQLREKYENREP